MDPQQLSKTSKFYSRSKTCDIEKTLGGWVPPPLGSQKVKSIGKKCIFSRFAQKILEITFCRLTINYRPTVNFLRLIFKGCSSFCYEHRPC